MALDQHSPDVAAFLKFLTGEIEQRRNSLEKIAKTPDETAFLRGEIKAFRKVVAQLTSKGDLTGDE